jgi:hypothetical protein
MWKLAKSGGKKIPNSLDESVGSYHHSLALSQTVLDLSPLLK